MLALPSSTPNIAEALSSQTQKKRLDRRKCFLKIVANVRFLAHQGLPLRGHGDQECDSNFMQLLKLRSAVFAFWGVFFYAKSVGFPQTPMGELTALPHTPWLGGRGTPLPHPPRGTPPFNFGRCTFYSLPTPLLQGTVLLWQC